MTQPLMPMATAVWLVDNTSLTFRQIADFTGLHELEIQGIADETVGTNIVGRDPIANGQLTHTEIERCQKDASLSLVLQEDDVKAVPRTKGPRYTPVSKRQDKPDAIAWLVRHHPELSDLQISRLVGTTKPTIASIRSRSHWNIQNIKPHDPVGLGLCRQSELDEVVKQAADKRAKMVQAGEVAPVEQVVSENLTENDSATPDSDEAFAQRTYESPSGQKSSGDAEMTAAQAKTSAEALFSKK